jgi:hypothetical protein
LTDQRDIEQNNLPKQELPQLPTTESSPAVLGLPVLAGEFVFGELCLSRTDRL